MLKIIVFLIIYYIYANTSLMFYTNSTYDLINNINLKRKELLVATHDYQFIDVMLLISEYVKKKIKVTFVVDDILSHYVLKYYLYSINVFWIDFIYVKGGTVKKVKDTIIDEPVIIYLHRKSESTGIYYMLSKEIKLYLCKIKSDYISLDYKYDNANFLDIIKQNFGKHYKVKYSQIDYDLNNNAYSFIKNLKTYLYN